MRGKAFLCLLVVALLMTPVQAGDVSAMQQQPAEDPKQPNANNTTMYIWSNGMSAYWTHFNNNDTEGTGNDCDDEALLTMNFAKKRTVVLSASSIDSPWTRASTSASR